MLPFFFGRGTNAYEPSKMGDVRGMLGGTWNLRQGRPVLPNQSTPLSDPQPRPDVWWGGQEPLPTPLPQQQPPSQVAAQGAWDARPDHGMGQMRDYFRQWYMRHHGNRQPGQYQPRQIKGQPVPQTPKPAPLFLPWRF